MQKKEKRSTFFDVKSLHLIYTVLVHVVNTDSFYFPDFFSNSTIKMSPFFIPVNSSSDCTQLFGNCSRNVSSQGFLLYIVHVVTLLSFLYNALHKKTLNGLFKYKQDRETCTTSKRAGDIQT